MNVGQQTLGAEIFTNVEITVVDKKRKILRQTIKKHNKATRQFVTGILRFIMGNFNASTRNSKPYYSDTEQYIPCYIGVGDGGVTLDDDGYPVYDSETKIPELSQTWTEKVPYTSKKLNREFYVKNQAGATLITGSRTPIRKVGNTTQSVPAGDMDTIYFYCEIGPGELNTFYGGRPIILTELGLFAEPIPNTEDLLAYVKLGNYTEEINEGGVTEIVEKTRTLYVRPEDTVIVKWYVTIAAIGEDSIFSAKDRDIPISTTVSSVTVNDIPDPEYDDTKITIVWRDKSVEDPEPFKYEYDNLSDVVTFLRGTTVPGDPTKWLMSGSCDVVIGNKSNVTSLQQGQFSGITTLRNITLSNKITSIPDGCFYNVRYLEHISIPNTVTSIGNAAFGQSSQLSTYMKEITIPSSVTSIGAGAFSKCTNLEYVNLPSESTMTFGASCFEYCIYLKSFVIPNGVTAISPGMFTTCARMESLTIPGTVTTSPSGRPLSGAGDYRYVETFKIYLGNSDFLPWDYAAWGNNESNTEIISI